MEPSKIAAELALERSPVAIMFTDEKPAGAIEYKPGQTGGCVIALLTAATKGKTAVMSQETCGCIGGTIGLGFDDHGYDKFPGGIEYFLSTGRGEGYPEGEGYVKTPELARKFAQALPATKIPTKYVVFKPLTEVDLANETPQEVVFYANPDQLSALVVMANYAREGTDNVAVRMASGCQSIGIIAYAEAGSDTPRAVLGMLDVSARPYVPANLLSFTVPFSMYLEIEGNIAGSFLQKSAWQKVRRRIERTTKGEKHE